MKKNVLIWLVFLLSIVTTTAQNNLPPVFEITTDTALAQYLDTVHWQMLRDKAGKLTFDEVTKLPLVNRFHYKKKESSTNQFAADGYWLRYVLKNVMERDAKICFGFLDTYEQSDFYFINEKGEVTHQVNGFFNPYRKLTGIKEYRIIPIELKQGEKIIVYNRVFYTNHVFTFAISNKPAAYSSTEKVMQRIYSLSQTAYFNGIHDIFIVGVLAFASLFSFMFFIIIREKVYLYFSLYLFSLCIGRFNTNLEMDDVFFREHPYTYSYIYSFIWFFSIFFLIHFIRYLLNTKEYFPK